MKQPGLDRERLEHAFLLALGRKPSPKEIDRLATLLAQQRREYLAEPAAAAVLVSKKFTASGSGASDAPEDKNEPAVSANSKEVSELAEWTAISRALLNLDDFMTRE